MKKIILVFSLLFFVFGFSQEETVKEIPSLSKRWNVKFGINMVRSAGDGSPFGKFSENALSIPISLGIEYKINDEISVSLLQSVNKWKANEGVIDGIPVPEDQSYFGLDAGLKLYFDEYFLDADWLSLYVEGGLGFFHERESGISGNLGGGGIIWLSQSLGLNLQGLGKFAGKGNNNTNHFQYFAGLVYNFGGVDTDNDGILDKEDECPEEFGLIQFNGCPDSDGDGVKESLDECPLVYGPAALKGCPDRDNDGVADKNDECPDSKGSVNTRGCPDRDKDGIPDKFDNCPEVPGSFNNRGCPWKDTDKDGVIDKDDRCPNQIGPIENRGCPYPKLTQTEEKIIDAFAETILFDMGKADLRDSSKGTLDRIVSLMNTYKNERFHIAGHTDNTFTSDFNQVLSQNRAVAVRNYFLNKGIAPSRLTAKGYGETKPISSNSTEAGRAKNRRVAIILIK
ncbi:MAG: OmpA family protein [Bacteroidia bacterium]|nr:OmpA family protein [Bacteroidia bacterium]